MISLDTETTWFGKRWFAMRSELNDLETKIDWFKTDLALGRVIDPEQLIVLAEQAWILAKDADEERCFTESEWKKDMANERRLRSEKVKEETERERLALEGVARYAKQLVNELLRVTNALQESKLNPKNRQWASQQLTEMASMLANEVARYVLRDEDQ